MTVLVCDELFSLEANDDPRTVNLYEVWGDEGDPTIRDLLKAFDWDIQTTEAAGTSRGHFVQIVDPRAYVVYSRVNHGYEVFVIPDSDDPWSYVRFYERGPSLNLLIELNGGMDTPERVDALKTLGFVEGVADEEQYQYL